MMIITEESVRVEVIQRFTVLFDKLDQLKWFEDEKDIQRRRKGFALVCRVKKDELKGIMELIKTLDLNEVLTDIYKKVREYGYKGKVTRKMIEVFF